LLNGLGEKYASFRFLIAIASVVISLRDEPPIVNPQNDPLSSDLRPPPSAVLCKKTYHFVQSFNLRFEVVDFLLFDLALSCSLSSLRLTAMRPFWLQLIPAAPPRSPREIPIFPFWFWPFFFL